MTSQQRHLPINMAVHLAGELIRTGRFLPSEEPRWPQPGHMEDRSWIIVRPVAQVLFVDFAVRASRVQSVHDVKGRADCSRYIGISLHAEVV